MRRCLLVPFVLLFVGGLADQSEASQALPQSWRRTMTSDPDANYFLKAYSGDLATKMATVVRNIMLFRLLSTGCRDVNVSQVIVDRYAKKSGFLELGLEDGKNASRLGAAQFDYFDYDALAHLCAGSDYLFGSRGVLIKDAMSKGSGELAIPYNPENLYLKVRPIIPE